MPRKKTQKPPVDREFLPPWLPTDDRWDDLPEAVRQAIPTVLAPAYRQFVLEVSDELERSIGLTLVHLLWIELCNQTHMAESVADPTSLSAALNDPDRLIDRYLSLVTAKSQTTELLTRLRLINHALTHSAVPSVPSVSSVPSLPPPSTLSVSSSAVDPLPPSPGGDNLD